MSQKPSRIIKAEQSNELDVWSLPNVHENASKGKDNQTNAFGQKRTWKYEPPEEEVSEPEPLTAQEIEEIRQAAHDEGFSQGKEEGFAKGYEEGKAQGIEEGTLQGIEQGNEQGLAQGKASIDALGEKWQQLIEQLHKPLANVEKNIEEQLLNLVVQLTEAVVLQEAKMNPDILMAADRKSVV